MEVKLSSFFLLCFTFFFINSYFLIAIEEKKEYQFKVFSTNQLAKKEDFLLTISAENKTENEILLQSKQDGFFYEIENEKKSIFLPSGKYFFTVDFQNKSSPKKKINFQQEKIVLINVDSLSSKELKNITTVQADKFFKKDPNKISLIAKEVKLIPGSGNDILSSVVSVPGIVGTSQEGDIYIRGSDRDDIYYAINNIRISNPFHDIFYSAIPNAIVHSLDLYLGGFKNDFANVQGGVIQAKTKNINHYLPNKIDIEADVNFIYTGINFNIPIQPNMRINIGGKRSYYSIWLGFLESINFYQSLGFQDVELDPFFEDYNFFFDWKINKNLYLRFFVIYSNDDSEVKYESARTNSSNQKVTTTIEYVDVGKWNTEALELIFEKENLKNTFNIYHYGNTNFFAHNGNAYRRYGRDYFVVKDHFNYSFLKNKDIDLSLQLGSGITYELATFIYMQHPDGKQIPVASEYHVFFDSNGRPLEDNENFRRYTNDFLQYHNELVEKISSPYRWVSESYSFFEANFLKAFNINLGGNFNYNSYSKKIDIDWRGQMIYQKNKNLTFFIKGGKYSQLPELFTYVSKNRSIEPQARYLTTPFAYHLNFGFDFAFSIFTLNTEGYYKYLTSQEISNPTYDTAFLEDENNNPKALNLQEGSSYGVDIFIKQSFTKSSFGWIAYSWNKSDRRVFIDTFRETLTTFGLNNGTTYKNLKTKITPFRENIEHVFKFLYSFQIIKNLQFGLNGSVLSGKAFTKYVLDELESINGDKIFIIKSDGEYGRFPWRFTLHSRLDWTFFKNDSLSITAYLDFRHLHTLLIKNINGFQYDIKAINDEKNTTYKDLKKGDPFPEDAIFPVNSIERILGIFGVMLKL